MRRSLLATLLLLCALLVFAELRYRGAKVVSRDADPQAFSAERARDAVDPFIKAPRPTGTPALAAARARVIERLRAIGLQTDERSTVVCGRYGVCARVGQVLSRLAGAASTGAVLLLAHLDSVGASPGASDDGAGVATVLEVARALSATGPARNDVLFLIVEGEELGLLGAEAFVREDPRAREVRIVVNVEARGTRGAASLFQISRDSRFVVEAARAMRRPVGSSVFVSVYERMPNDTDLSVFLGRGYAGMNFAFSEGVESYHTARDDRERQDPSSVQHLGDCALMSVRALAATDLTNPARGELVFFDVLAFTIVRYPMSWAFPLACAVLAALVAIALVRSTIGEIAIGVATWLLTVALAAVFGVAIFAAVRAAGALPTPWIARPAAILFALLAAGIAATLTGVAVGRRLLSLRGYSLAIAIMHAVLGVAVARLLPGGSYLFVVPALIAAIASFAPPRLFIAVFGLAQVTVWIVVLRSLYPALGAMAAPALPLVAAIMMVPFAPLLLEDAAIARPFAIALAAFAGVATTIAALSRPFSERIPQRVNVVVAREENKRARIGIDPTWGGQPWGPPPPAMIAALGPLRSEPIVPWRDDPIPVADLDLDIAPPKVTVVERAASRLRLRIRSARGAPTLYVIARQGAGLAHIELAGAVGSATFFRRSIAPGGRGLRIDGLEEADVTLLFSGPVGELTVADASYGTPPHPALVARPNDAVATQDGDLTIAYRFLRP